MPPLYDLTIMAPDHSLFSGRVQSLVAPGAEGHFGVLARHAPMVAQLGTGVLSITLEGGEVQYFAIHSGFLEVEPDGVMVLADTAEAAAEIDVERARAAEQRARERIRKRDTDMNVTRAEAALRRSVARLRAVEKSHGLG